MPIRKIGSSVFDAALDRLIPLYEEGHRIVVQFSGGKDSTVVLELCTIAARLTGRLPVEVCTRDEEIMFPGTFEYTERVARRADMKFWWLVAHQPVVNIFDREKPYFWVCDPLLSPDAWVRVPPSDLALDIPEQHIQGMTVASRMPPDPGKKLIAVLGLRVQESISRRRGLHSSGGYLTQPNAFGTVHARPIYDWTDADVWKAIQDNKWDYNNAYDVMYRMGVARSKLRIAPPTLSAAGLDLLPIAAKAWPHWFDRVSNRLRGVRTAAMFGRRAVIPHRRLGETWEDCFRRECVGRAPDWIAERAAKLAEVVQREHSGHSSQPLPQNQLCPKCGLIGSWKNLADVIYMGDPFSLKQHILPVIEPEFFREGAGKWGGKPTW